jgi:pilus assembly protein CpaC
MWTIALALALTAAPQSGAMVRLLPGAQTVLKVPGLTRVAVGDAAIADVSVTGAGEVLVLGKQRGRTSILLWAKGQQQSREVLVDDGKASEVERTVRELVSPSLKVDTFNGKVVIDGTLDSVGEYERLMRLVGDDPNVKVLATLNPRVLPVLAETITGALKKAGLGNARAVAVGQKLFLEGTVADEQELKRALGIVEAWVGLTQSNLRTR